LFSSIRVYLNPNRFGMNIDTAGTQVMSMSAAIMAIKKEI